MDQARLTAAIAAVMAARWAGLPAPAPRLHVRHTAARIGFGTWYQCCGHISMDGSTSAAQLGPGH